MENLVEKLRVNHRINGVRLLFRWVSQLFNHFYTINDIKKRNKTNFVEQEKTVARTRHYIVVRGKYEKCLIFFCAVNVPSE